MASGMIVCLSEYTFLKTVITSGDASHTYFILEKLFQLLNVSKKPWVGQYILNMQARAKVLQDHFFL